MTTELVAMDIGGTHARFALARIEADGTITLGDPVALHTADHAGLESAWAQFAAHASHPLPRNAALAIAAPVIGTRLRMTNAPWEVDTARLASALGLDRLVILNDFGAVAHAIARLGDSACEPLCGPPGPLPETGTVTVMGPGTGLGIAHFHRFGRGDYHVQATEGAHMAYGPLDEVDDRLVARLRARHGRVSVERVVSGPGLAEICAVLDNFRPLPDGDAALWQKGIDGSDPLAAAAVERFCETLGSVAGDYALAHGASAVVLSSGLAVRLRDHLRAPGFARRFCDKGRYRAMLSGIPVRLFTHPQPGLYGAAAAFAQEHAP